jgi:hypothetical protein
MGTMDDEEIVQIWAVYCPYMQEQRYLQLPSIHMDTEFYYCLLNRFDDIGIKYGLPHDLTRQLFSNKQKDTMILLIRDDKHNPLFYKYLMIDTTMICFLENLKITKQNYKMRAFQ